MISMSVRQPPIIPTDHNGALFNAESINAIDPRDSAQFGSVSFPDRSFAVGFAQSNVCITLMLRFAPFEIALQCATVKW